MRLLRIPPYQSTGIHRYQDTEALASVEYGIPVNSIGRPGAAASWTRIFSAIPVINSLDSLRHICM
jgi:hypothetical protein